jgi:Zn-dependent M28 family amino/carboxypeptidase
LPKDSTGDGICNGAVDNATGVGALMALAEANVKAGPARRSQVFVALTLEESGLLGSEFYGQNPLYPLSKTVGGVNMDALAPIGRARNYAMTGGDKSELTAIFRGVLAQEGLYESPEDHTERGHYYRSDHFSLAKRGVPMFDIARAGPVRGRRKGRRGWHRGLCRASLSPALGRIFGQVGLVRHHPGREGLLQAGADSGRWFGMAQLAQDRRVSLDS